MLAQNSPVPELLAVNELGSSLWSWGNAAVTRRSARRPGRTRCWSPAERCGRTASRRRSARGRSGQSGTGYGWLSCG